MRMIIPTRYQPTGGSSCGGMGDIYECIDTHLNRCVVLKMLKDGEESRRLLDEQKALTRLRSKHVVQLYDVISVLEESVPKTSLVLEHIDGKDLLEGSMVQDKVYLNTLWQIASGLKDIHHANIIHRDIKPNNIRIDRDGVIKILDFGLARRAGIEAKTMSIIGTPGYMAPELWGTKTISFDKTIDVYAFGVMALTLIDPAIPGELRERPPKPFPTGTLAGLLTGVPTDVVAILERCLSHISEQRPSIDAVEAILRRHLLPNRHRALLVLGGKTHEINATTPNVTVKSGDVGVIGISYDGLRFTVSSLSGSVFVNNTIINIGEELPGCCVIAFGPRESARRFCTFDVSNPEVMP